MKCQVCGRTEEELEEEFGIESPISERQGIDKCEKCHREYQRETSGEKTDQEEMESKNWKDAITA